MIVRSYNPIWSFVDLNGKQADDTFYLYTLQNTLPYLPSPIWKDQSQTTQWSDPIQFLANGTLPDNLYWDDSIVYRLEIRQNNGIQPPSQNDALIYVVENYIPSTGGGSEPGVDTADSENMITNPQFATLNFSGSLVINTATTTEFAPGWSVITTGAGTLTLSQSTYLGNSWTPSNATNAATGLHVVNNGFSNVEFIQRFNGNGALWTGAQSASDSGPGVAANITASAQVAAKIVVSVKYNDGVRNTTVINENLSTSNEDLSGASIIFESTNTTQPTSAWTELSINLTSSTTYELTSVQLVGQQIVQKIQYIQTTPQRQIDQEFNYYLPQLEYKPIPSYLVGWDFPLNPAQLFGDSGALGAIGANTSGYAWDQTIVFQSVNNSIAWARNSSNKGFVIAPTINTSFAIIQYLPIDQAREILNQNNAIQLSGFLSSGTLNGTVNLYYTTDTSLPDLKTPNYNSLVVSIAAGGIPTVGSGAPHGTWVQVPNLVSGYNAPFTMTTSDTPISFTGFNGIAGANTAQYIAIVVAFDTLNSGITLTLDYISLVGGDIATRPAPKTLAQTLQECQYYYEMSYIVPSDVGTATDKGSYFLPMNALSTPASNIANLYASPWSLSYKSIKIKTPTNTFYGTDGAINNVYAVLYYQDNSGGAGVFTAGAADAAISTFWTSENSTKSEIFVPKTNTPLKHVVNSNGTDTFASGGINFQYISDARLGIVL